MVLIPKINIDEDIVDLSFIKKFNFKSFDKETYEEINSVKYEKYLNSKIMNTFFMDDYNTLAVLTCTKEEYIEEEGENDDNNGEGGYIEPPDDDGRIYRRISI